VLHTGGFVAFQTIEMYMIMVMMALIAGCTNGVFRLELFIRNAMKNTSIQKLFQTTVNGSPVNDTRKSRFKVRVGKRIGMAQECFQNFYSLVGLPEFKILKERCRLIFH